MPKFGFQKIVYVLIVICFAFIIFRYNNPSDLNKNNLDMIFLLIRQIQNGQKIEFLSQNIKLPKIDAEQIFITFYYKNRLKGCYGVDSTSSILQNNSINDIYRATRLAMDDKRFADEEKITDFSKLDTLITFLNSDIEIYDLNQNFDKKYIRGQHSLKIQNGSKYAFYLASVPLEHHWDNKTVLKNLCKKAGMRVDCHEDINTKIITYKTTTYLKNKDNTISEYYKHVNYQDFDINKSDLVNNVKSAVEWLDDNKTDNGFTYSYLITDRVVKNISKYNYIRQLITLRAYIIACRISDNDCLNNTKSYFEKVNDFYYSKSVLINNTLELRENNNSNPALNAAYILFLKDSTIDNKQMLITQLADNLITKIRVDGSVISISTINDVSRDIYTGEVYLALIEAYEVTKNPVYLDYFKKGIPYLTAIANSKKNFYLHWISQALYKYYIVTNDTDVAMTVFMINDWLIDNYQFSDPSNKFEFGAFSKENPGFNTAFVLESLIDAYDLSIKESDLIRQSRYASSIKYAVRFMTQLWFTDKNSHYFIDANLVKGTMMDSVNKNEVRVDYVGHALTALKKILDTNLYK